MKSLSDGRARINEGVIILFAKAIKQPGLTIPIVSTNLDDATYYYKAFCKYLVRGRIQSVNSRLRLIELNNGSRFTFPIDTQENQHEQKYP